MTIYKLPSGSYRVDIRRHRRGEKPYRDTAVFTTKTQAEAYEKKSRAVIEKAQGRNLAIPGRTTLSDLLDDWWKDQQETIAPSNRRATHRRVKMWQKSHLGNALVAKLTIEQTSGWLRTRRKDDRAAESTVRNDLSILKKVWKWAEKEKRWSLPDVIAPLFADHGIGQSRERDRRLSADEHDILIHAFQALADAQAHWDTPRGTPIAVEIAPGVSLKVGYSPGLVFMPAAFQAAIECAARKSLLFSLRWKQIDLARRYIHITVRGSKNKEVPAEIPISPKLEDMLREMRGPERIGAALDEPLFGTLTKEIAYRCFLDVIKTLKIKDLRWHDLRHEAVSKMAEAGLSAGLIQQVTGHKKLVSVERYMHVKPKAVLEAWDRLKLLEEFKAQQQSA